MDALCPKVSATGKRKREREKNASFDVASIKHFNFQGQSSRRSTGSTLQNNKQKVQKRRYDIIFYFDI
jgi:hypothetical protein